MTFEEADPPYILWLMKEKNNLQINQENLLFHCAKLKQKFGNVKSK